MLEVGAGIGATTRALCDGRQREWVALEPDPELAERCRASFASEPLSPAPEVVNGALAAIPAEPRFDAILYVDVLEHIEADRAELAEAARRLRPGGALVVISPAHGWLYTEFDRRIGHHRRYTASSLLELTPAGLEVARCHYLDSVGLLASLGNRVLLRRGLPSPSQLWVWDRLMVPLSRGLDRVLCHGLGKTIAVEWRRPGGAV